MRKILIIENDKKAATRAAEALKKGLDGVDVQTCLTGIDGLKNLKKKTYDLVISESRLSDMTGFELLKSMAEIRDHRAVIIISSAGWGDEALNYIRKGVYDFIAKDSFFPQKLVEAVRKALNLGLVFDEKMGIVETEIQRERRRELSRMAHVLNHEVNNPLMTIIGNVQLLLTKPEVKPGELSEKLKAIEDSAQRIARIMAFLADRNNENYIDQSSEIHEQVSIPKRPQ
jgi:DNA-binding NarL/FixJ family response regulator